MSKSSANLTFRLVLIELLAAQRRALAAFWPSAQTEKTLEWLREQLPEWPGLAERIMNFSNAVPFDQVLREGGPRAVALKILKRETSAKPAGFATIEQAAQAGASDHLTATRAAWLAFGVAAGAAHAACEGTPEPSTAAFVATIAVVEMYSRHLGFSPESAKELARQAAYVAQDRAALLYSQRSMTFQVSVDDALSPEEKARINMPGRSAEERRALRDVIVRECILLGKPLPALVERYDRATTGGRKIAQRAMKVNNSAELVAYFKRLRADGMSIKQAEIQTTEMFQLKATKTVQRHRKRQGEKKSGHL